MSSQLNIEQQSITTFRTLAMDAVQAANSGYPGTPMSAPLQELQKMFGFTPETIVAAARELLQSEPGRRA